MTLVNKIIQFQESKFMMYPLYCIGCSPPQILLRWWKTRHIVGSVSFAWNLFKLRLWARSVGKLLLPWELPFFRTGTEDKCHLFNVNGFDFWCLRPMLLGLYMHGIEILPRPWLFCGEKWIMGKSNTHTLVSKSLKNHFPIRMSHIS